MKLASAAGRWVVAGSVLGSGAVFLEGTVVNVAVPAIARDLHLEIGGLQWVLNAYLLTLSALMLLGGAIGDRMRRSRVFALGCLGFALASLASAIAPNLAVLVMCRLLQGVAGALLVPNSLAMLEEAFEGEERGAAIGQWAAWSAVSTAIGPLAGGTLVDALSWRWVFAAVVPFAIAAAMIAVKFVNDKPRDASRHIDVAGAILITLALAGIIGGLTTGADHGFTSPIVLATIAAGVACLIAFLLVERRSNAPLLPLDVFRSAQFTGANLVTLLVYAALTALMFFLMLELQNVLGYSALEAGASLLPVNVFMLLISPRAGRLAERIGAKLPMAGGAAIAAVGIVLFTRVHAGATYLSGVLPGASVFGIGLSIFVAPLTAAVLGAVPAERVGVASAVNNAVSRVAGLVALAILPFAAGLTGAAALTPGVLSGAFERGMWISAALCLAGAAVAFLTVSGEARTQRAGSEAGT